jgi:16S rRNA (uracil1498-N3)-methyltransferase
MAHEKRFFAESIDPETKKVTFSDRDAAHMKRSLRLSAGDSVTAVGHDGALYEVVLEELRRRGAAGRLVMQLPDETPAENYVDIWLVQGLPKGRQKMDLIVRQSTEVGVDHILFVPTKRSNATLSGERVADREERWDRVAREASTQSRRLRLPTVDYCETIEDVLDALPAGCGMLVAWENDQNTGICEAVEHLGPDAATVALFIGPEGGFAASECEFLQSRGAITFHLGDTVLRSETAAPVVTALLRHELGLM